MKYLLLLLTCFAQVTAGPKITNITPTSSMNNARVDISPPITITLESAATVDHINFGETTIVTAFTQPTGNTIHIASGALPPSAPGTVTVTITYSDTSTSPANHPFDYYTYQGNWLTYVPDIRSGAIYVFDFANPTNPLIDTLLPPTAIAINTSFMAVITPDGKYAYCTSNIGSFFTNAPYLTIIDTANQSTTIKSFTDIGIVSGFAPTTLANSPDGNMLVVVGHLSGFFISRDQAYKIDVTNRTTPTAGTSSTYTVGHHAFGVSFTPDSSDKAYVVNTSSSDISIINLLDGPSTSNPSTYMDTTLSGAFPNWLAPFPVDVSSSTFFDLVLGVSQVLLYEDPLVAGSPQDPTNVPGAYSSHSSQIIPSPDSKFAYVPNFGTDNNISIIDLAPSILMQTGVITPPAGFGILEGIAIDPDGKNGIVCGFEITVGGGILRFSTTSPTAQTFIDLGPMFFGGYSATTPDQSPVAYASHTVFGTTVSFTGSGSLSPTGDVVSWFWDFGDGHFSTDTNPMHDYATSGPGPFTVTLTVTNSAGTSTGQTYFGQMMYNNGGPQARTQFQVSVSSNLLPPSRATITQQKKICPIRNTLTIYPPLSGPQPTNYLVYTSPNKRGLVANVPATTGPVQVTVKARCQATCYYIFSQDNSGISSTYLQKCIK